MLASRNDLKHYFLCDVQVLYTLHNAMDPKKSKFSPPPAPSPSRSGGKVAILLESLKIGKAATKSDVTARLGGAERTNFFGNLHKNTFSEATEHASVQKRSETTFFVRCGNCMTSPHRFGIGILGPL